MSDPKALVRNRLLALNRIRMTMGDGLLLHIAADTGDVLAVERLLRKYGVTEPMETAADLVEAREEARQRPPVAFLVREVES